jgi:hypothetical protein
MKSRDKRPKARRKSSPISARLPLPRKGEARHGDVTKYDRPREKVRLRRQIRVPEETE